MRRSPALKRREGNEMIEAVVTGVALILFYLSVVMFGADTRDGEDWYKHSR